MIRNINAKWRIKGMQEFDEIVNSWIEEHISYMDAALLRELHAGACVVADAYGAIAGVIVGGLGGHFVESRNKSEA